MKRALIFSLMFILLMSFVFADLDVTRERDINRVRIQEENQREVGALIKERAEARNLTREEVQNIIQEKNRIRIEASMKECPEDCVCAGATIKCKLDDGGREMTIIAGKSGNVIVQIQRTNASTNVTLYKADGNVYGVFKGDETRIIRMMPDQVRERIREKINSEIEDSEIELDEGGVYNYEGRKQARLIGFIPVRVRVRAQINSENGEVVRVRKSWWAFLARDSNPILGAGCGTVSPDERDKCCKAEGYDYFDLETQQCEFSQ